MPIVHETDLVVMERGSSDDDILAQAGDADFILADAISPVSACLIQDVPNLKLAHSEGVAYNAIDLDAARKPSVVVCNNAGANADGVAEQAIMLMLACPRDAINADAAVRAGNQIQTKGRMMVEDSASLAIVRWASSGSVPLAKPLHAT